MVKLRMYYDKDRAVKWLNKMSEQGNVLTGVTGGIFHFEQGPSGKYLYQADFSEKFFSVSDDYRSFMEDAGVEIIAIWGPWVYLRKLAADGEFSLYTDVDSSIDHYKKIRRMFKIFTALEGVAMIAELYGFYKGNQMAMLFFFLIAALFFIFVNITFRTNAILAELYARKGETPDRFTRRKVSLILIIGLFMNSITLMVRDSTPDYLHNALQILALLFMLGGIVRTYFLQRQNI